MSNFFIFFYISSQFCWHISSGWIKIRLYTENQLHRLSGSGLKVFFWGFFMAPHFFWHISSTWVKKRLYTENQLPRLSGCGLKVCGGMVSVPLCCTGLPGFFMSVIYFGGWGYNI